MTTLTELLTNKAKIQYKPEIVLVRNPKLQEFINDLNSMFLKNWTPLFKENESYENWSEETKSIPVYLNKGYSESILLDIKNTSLNEIVILYGQSFTSKQFSITLEDAYKTILIRLIEEKFRTCFQEKFKDSYLGKSFEPHSDFISMFKTIRYVFGKDSLIEKENSVKFKDKIISIPNLEIMKLYYGEKKDFDIKDFVEKNIKDYSIKIFELLKVHFKIKLQLVTTINDLSDVYFKEINNYYKKYHIEKIKKVYLETCNKYFINPNEYILMPGLTNNNLYWDLIPKRTTLATDDTYYFLNNYMFHRLFQKVSKENFHKSLEEMKKDMFRHFLFYKQENITKQIIQESSESLYKIKNYSRFFEEKIDFNGEELKVKRSGNVFTLTHNLYRLYYDYSVHNIDVRTVNFAKMEEDENIENEWENFCKEIENECNLFIEFLNS